MFDFTKITAWAFLIFCLVPPYLLCQTTNDNMRIPTLNNHTFVPVSMILGPFIDSHFQTYTGIGTSLNFNSPIYNLEGEPILGLTGEILFADLAVHYQQRITNWVAFKIKYSYAARLGTNVQTIWSQGFNTISSLDIGWHIKIYKSDKTYLSSIIELQNANGKFVDVRNYIKDLILSNPHPSMTRDVPVLTGGVGLRFAWGVNSFIGFRGIVQSNWGEDYERTTYKLYHTLGTSLDFNFNQRYNIPAGLVFAYSLTSQPDVVYSDSGYANIFTWKLAYTGARDFSIGLESSLLTVPLPELENTPTVNTTALVAKYYF
jgi:hypothetical protein